MCSTLLSTKEALRERAGWPFFRAKAQSKARAQPDPPRAEAVAAPEVVDAALSAEQKIRLALAAGEGPRPHRGALRDPLAEAPRPAARSESRP